MHLFNSKFFEVLKKAKVKYLLAGGMAVNLHGIPRTTMDIDIIIGDDKANILKLCAVLKTLGFRPQLPLNPEDLADPAKREAWIKEKNMIAFSFRHKTESFRVIDIVLVHPLDFCEAVTKSKTFHYKSIPVNTVGLDDLITMKKFSGRTHDLIDTEMLEEIKRIQNE